jgi:3-hydroxyacyl-CoA dehydrogenase
MVETDNFKKIVVVGAGTMGHEIAQVVCNTM